MKKLQCIYAMEYYCVVTKNWVLLFITWMGVEVLMLTEKSQAQTDKYNTFPSVDTKRGHNSNCLHTKKVSLFLFSWMRQKNNNLRAKSRKGCFGSGDTVDQGGKAWQLGLVSWGWNLVVWPLVPLQEEAELACKPQAAFLDPLAHPARTYITRGFHNQPRKHHYLGNGFKYMSLLGAVHFQATTEGYTPGERDGNLLTDLKKQVGRETKFKYTSHSRVKTVCNSSLVIL